MKTAYQYLSAKYPENECVILSEVENSSSSRRYLDYMVVNLWESRGQSIIGFEVKSYRGDWINELKKPQKQELHAPYCDYFYLLTMDEKIAKLEEIPENWGWMTVRGDRLFTLKKAPKQDAKPIPKHMMVGMIRRAADRSKYIHRETFNEEVQKLVEEKVERGIRSEKANLRWQLEQYNNLKKAVEEFEKASGINISHRWDYDSKKIGEAVEWFVHKNPEELIDTLKRISSISESLFKDAEKGIELLNETKNIENGK